MSKSYVSSEWEERIVVNWHELVSFFIVFTLALLYIFYAPFKEWMDFQIGIILSDWQLIFAVCVIIALTIGWYFIEGVALVVIGLNIKINQKLTSKSLNKVRFVMVVYFIVLICSYYFFPYTFIELTLWIISFLIFFAIMMGTFGLRYFIRQIQKQRIESGKIQPKEKPLTIKEKYESSIMPEPLPDNIIINLWIAIVIGFSIILVVVLYLTNGLGFKNIVDHIYLTINSNFIVSLLFWIIILITILWKPILWLSLFINYMSMKLIKKSIKRKINTTRILLILFVVLMVIVGNLPILADIFGWDEIQVQIMSIIIGFVASAIITYVIRRPR
jgi:hypothetical protein